MRPIYQTHLEGQLRASHYIAGVGDFISKLSDTEYTLLGEFWANQEDGDHLNFLP
jgi:hypothetical protein